MTLSNQELVRRFVDGATSGQSNRMEIIEGPEWYNGDLIVSDGETALVGYDWAVYAIRTNGGRVNINWGWYKWAKDRRQRENMGGQTTTERHMELVEGAAGPHAIMTERRRQIAEAPPSTQLVARSVENRHI